MKSIILRVSNPYGERQRIETAQGAVAVFLHRALKNLPVDIWGDGSVTRDYIYIDDVANAFVRALMYKGRSSVFNVSSGKGVSINDLLIAIENEVGYNLSRNYLSARLFDVPVSILCNDHAKKELAWVPKSKLSEGLGLTAAWIKKSLI